MATHNAPLPIDGNRKPVQLVPSRTALVVTVDATISSSTTVTLNAATTFIEVNALSQGIYLKYGSTVSSSSFDEYIQAGSVRHYFIPQGVTQVSVIEQAASATVILIEK